VCGVSQLSCYLLEGFTLGAKLDYLVLTLKDCEILFDFSYAFDNGLCGIVNVRHKRNCTVIVTTGLNDTSIRI